MLVAFQLKHMLNSKGQTATYTKVEEGTYDPSTGSVTNTSTIYTVKAYFAQFSLSETDSITSGSRSVLVGITDTNGDTIPEPTTNDTLTGVLGDVSTITSTQKIYSGNNVVCYICGVEE